MESGADGKGSENTETDKPCPNIFRRKERKLKELKEGDHLAILDAGAYGYVMSSPYNSRPRPAEVLINNNSIYEIRKAETFDDLLKAQKIPEHLK